MPKKEQRLKSAAALLLYQSILKTFESFRIFLRTFFWCVCVCMRVYLDFLLPACSILINSNLFLQNAQGFPVWNSTHQDDLPF